MSEFMRQMCVICPLVFLSGLVDASAGGGGLISLPAYLLAGLPAHVAAGTNKVVAATGAVLSAVQYIRAGKVRWRAAVWSALAALIGAGVGSKVALLLSEQALRAVLLAALPCVAIFLVVRRNFGGEEKEKPMSHTRLSLLSVCIGFLIGAYDGLVGPGTGTFMILAFAGVLGYDLLTAGGCAKVSNSASNIGSAVLFLMYGKVLWPVVLPAIAFTMLGSYVGSRLAIRKGTGYIRLLIFAVIGMLFVKTIFEFLR